MTANALAKSLLTTFAVGAAEPGEQIALGEVEVVSAGHHEIVEVELAARPLPLRRLARAARLQKQTKQRSCKRPSANPAATSPNSCSTLDIETDN